MPVRRIHAHPRVRDAAGKVSLIRGPLVYCVEDADHEAILSGIVLPADAAINASESSAEGMVVLHAEGTAQSSSDELYSDRTISKTAVQIALFHISHGVIGLWVICRCGFARTDGIALTGMQKADSE